MQLKPDNVVYDFSLPVGIQPRYPDELEAKHQAVYHEIHAGLELEGKPTAVVNRPAVIIVLNVITVIPVIVKRMRRIFVIQCPACITDTNAYRLRH